MKSYLTKTVVLGSLMMAPVALAQGEKPNPTPLNQQDDQAEQQEQATNPKALIGKTFPNARLKATDASFRNVGQEADHLRVIYVFNVESDLETNWYEPWQGKNEAVIPTLEHLQAIHMRAQGAMRDKDASSALDGNTDQLDEEQTDEEQTDEPIGEEQAGLLVFALAAETFPGPTYGAQPGDGEGMTEDSQSEDPTGDAVKAEDRMQRIEEIRAKAKVSFPFLDAEPSTVTADLDLEENVILLVDAEGTIKFAAREGDLKDGEQDFLQLAILEVREGRAVTNPCGKPKE